MPPQKTREYTLVLDLDETLLHYDDQTEELRVRPYAEEFLEQLSQHYEIVIFTAALKDYANWAISCIGDGASEQYISYRLFR